MKGCPVTVWDGPYAHRCGLGATVGRCAYHGPFDPSLIRREGSEHRTVSDDPVCEHICHIHSLPCHHLLDFVEGDMCACDTVSTGTYCCMPGHAEVEK